jgi:hypothetical protein
MHGTHLRREVYCISCNTREFLRTCTICCAAPFGARQAALKAASRGTDMTAIVTRLASAVIAVSLSGAVLSLALV